MWRWALLVLPMPALAESLVAAQTIRAQSVLRAEDVVQVAADIPGALADPADAIGLEARATIYPGRPIRLADLGPPALVDRNEVVPLVYEMGPLSILTEGRALERGGEGDLIRILNIGSRTTVSGRVGADGIVRVGQQS
jgi:flagellar basal body P-ring formation protein FlgA